MSKKLIIVGNSAFSEIAKEYFNNDSNYEVVAFSVEKKFIKEKSLLGLPVVEFESLEKKFSPKNHSVYVAATYTQLNRLRARLSKESKDKGYKLASYISSNSFVWKNVKLGEHIFIFEDNTVQPFVEIKDNVLLWSGNHIGHHSTIQKNVFISSHVCISGFCNIGENSFLGVNSTVSNNVIIQKNNWIGPNKTIMKNTKENAFYRMDHPDEDEKSSLELFNLK